jgi:hypothetical protein
MRALGELDPTEAGRPARRLYQLSPVGVQAARRAVGQIGVRRHEENSQGGSECMRGREPTNSVLFPPPPPAPGQRCRVRPDALRPDSPSSIPRIQPPGVA